MPIPIPPTRFTLDPDAFAAAGERAFVTSNLHEIVALCVISDVNEATLSALAARGTPLAPPMPTLARAI